MSIVENRNTLTGIIMKDFRVEIFKAVGLIPKGRVATYGQVAQMAGWSSGASRAVGNAIHTNTDPIKVPCHRVVCADGRMGSNFGRGGPVIQRQILESEGVLFKGDRVDLERCGIRIEEHPLQPFLPHNASILFLGSFPPPKVHWSMHFFYPNWINDFWRIQGLIHFDNPNHFEIPGMKMFDCERIMEFCKKKGIAFYDTAKKICRLKGNASDGFLLVLEQSDIPSMLEQMPHCNTIATTGGKSSEELLNIIHTLESIGRAATVNGQKVIPTPGTKNIINISGREIEWWRMPSTSRAYPMPLLKKADAYKMLFFNNFNAKEEAFH